MKKMYWRPQKVSLRFLWLVTIIAVVGLFLVEKYQIRQQQPFYKEKLKAAHLTKRAFRAIKDRRLKLGVAIDEEADPTGSGVIGQLLTPVTTNPGHLPAKQTTINPNWGGVMVQLLEKAGVKEGDTVAVGFSGSFPAMNIATMAACEVLKLKPIIIASAGASQWGANITKFMWPDMETVLFNEHIISHKSIAASRGGIEDKALGLSPAGQRAIDRAIERNKIMLLESDDFVDSTEKRMSLYREMAGAADIKAYINVGGGTISVGTSVGKRMFKPGLNRSLPHGAATIDSVMTRFSAEGVPVIHITKIDMLAQRYGLPLQPKEMSTPGDGKIFYRDVHNRWLTIGVLATILVLLFAFIRLDWGYRIMTAGRRDEPKTRPEEMV